MYYDNQTQDISFKTEGEFREAAKDKLEVSQHWNVDSNTEDYQATLNFIGYTSASVSFKMPPGLISKKMAGELALQSLWPIFSAARRPQQIGTY